MRVFFREKLWGLRPESAGFHFRKYQKNFNIKARKYHFLKYKQLFWGWFFFAFFFWRGEGELDWEVRQVALKYTTKFEQGVINVATKL